MNLGVGSPLAVPASEWAPAWATKALHDRSDGSDVADFAAGWLTVPKGARAGRPLNFTPWQCWLLDQLLERRTDGRLRYRRALIGLPRKNGKSLLGSTLALYGLFAGEAGAEVYSAAGDRQQARIVFNEARHQVMSTPWLANRSKVYRDAIEVPEFGAVYRVLSADAKLQQGLNPSMVIFDELHVQRNDDMWDALTLGSGNRLDPLVVAITTAGYDLETLCGRLYQLGLRVATGETEDTAFGFWWWEAEPDCAVGDEAGWHKANPNMLEGLLDPEDMSVSSRQTSESAFRRFRLNQWVRAQESWLPSGVWESCSGTVQFDKERPMFVGVDMALKHDSIAVVWVQDDGTGRYMVDSKIWFPDGNTVDVAAVENQLRFLHKNFDVREIAYDPAYFERSAQALADDGLRVVEFPQSASRMVPACQTAFEFICEGRLVHNGAPAFTDQVLSAAPRDTDVGWRLSKGKSRRKIDACIALVMALSRAAARDQTPPKRIFAY